MPTGTPQKPLKKRFVPHNPSGTTTTRTLPKSVESFATQPREKKGEALVNDSFIKAKLISEQTQQLLLRPGKKDWNLIRNQVWCFGVLADKVLNTLENSEEIRIKLPSQLQEGVKLMVQLQIERAGSSVSPSAPETVRETVEPTENTTIPLDTTAYELT
jgi:hypothetical protein